MTEIKERRRLCKYGATIGAELPGPPWGGSQRYFISSLGFCFSLSCPFCPPHTPFHLPPSGQEQWVHPMSPCHCLSRTHPLMTAVTMIRTRRRKDKQRKHERNVNASFKTCWFLLTITHNLIKATPSLCKYSFKPSPLEATSTWMGSSRPLPQNNSATFTPEQLSHTASLHTSLCFKQHFPITRSLGSLSWALPTCPPSHKATAAITVMMANTVTHGFVLLTMLGI